MWALFAMVFGFVKPRTDAPKQISHTPSHPYRSVAAQTATSEPPPMWIEASNAGAAIQLKRYRDVTIEQYISFYNASEGMATAMVDTDIDRYMADVERFISSSANFSTGKANKP